MPANSNGLVTGWLAGKYPGWLGHIYSPGGQRGPYEFMPYGLDNGRFTNAWSEQSWFELLEWAADAEVAPMWILAPDEVGNPHATRKEWDRWYPVLERFRVPVAYAVQDGAEAEDVPDEAGVVFVGGSTSWKRATLHYWCDNFPRVHCGRINTERWLWYAYECGCESTDGTGWFRGDKRQLNGLYTFLDRASRGAGPLQRGFSWIRQDGSG